MHLGTHRWAIGNGSNEATTDSRTEARHSGRESAFELQVSGGIPAWRGRLRRSFDRYNELANALLGQLDLSMPAIDLDNIRAAPTAPRRPVTPPAGAR